jgi:hypothetical protein
LKYKTLNLEQMILENENLNEAESPQLNIGAVIGSLLSQVRELFAKLTDDERMEVLSDYCTYCGQNEKELGKCYCAPCYDE